MQNLLTLSKLYLTDIRDVFKGPMVSKEGEPWTGSDLTGEMWIYNWRG